jgi:hypothetical protein
MKNRTRGWRLIALGAVVSIMALAPASAIANSFQFSYGFGGGMSDGWFGGGQSTDITDLMKSFKNPEWPTPGTDYGHGDFPYSGGDWEQILGSDHLAKFLEGLGDLPSLEELKRILAEHFDEEMWKKWEGGGGPRSVPEPAAALVFAVGIGVISAGIRRRR